MAHPLQAKSFREMIGVPRSTAAPTDSSLLIIDAQNEYADGQLKTENVENTRKAIAGLVKTWREAGQGKCVDHFYHIPSLQDAPTGHPSSSLSSQTCTVG